MSKSLLIARDGNSAYASVHGQTIRTGAFIADILQCAEQLPDNRYLINLCAGRYAFSVAFFAAAVRGQINLLPSQRSAAEIERLRSLYRDVAVLSEQANADNLADTELQLTPGAAGTAHSPSLEPEAVVAVAFTSGSTGTPQAHAKTWGMLSRGRATHGRYLPGDPTQPRGLVATVPSWHMYGLEWALLLPTAAEFQLYCGSDFFPQDVLAALASFSVPTTLVSTPIHLKALLKSPAPQRPVSNTLSATAPLSAAQALALEAHLSTAVFEIYGCSEIGSLACRATVSEPHWTFFDDLKLQLKGETLHVAAPELPEAIALADRFAAEADDRYALLGRASDLIKVGGKRESLANLNQVLQRIDGVEDGVFYQPETFGLPETGRLAALVVAPERSVAELRALLAEQLDPLFRPRPIHRVDALPRQSTSKLAIDALRTLVLQQHDS